MTDIHTPGEPETSEPTLAEPQAAEPTATTPTVIEQAVIEQAEPAEADHGAAPQPVDGESSGAPDLAADTTTADTTSTAPPARPSRPLLRAAAAVLAAALVGVGIGEAIIKVRYDDRPAVAAAPAQPSASASPAWGAKSNGNHFGAMRDLLLPMPSGFSLGPDAGSLGNDAELGSDLLAKRLQKNLDDIPKQYQDRVRSAWEALHFKASGVRTYQSDHGDLLVEVYLDQFNQQAVSQTTELYGAMVDDTGVFRRGPEVPGHPGARCVLPPLRPGDKLDFVHCFSAEGDLLVTMEVSGAAPVNQDKVVDLFRQQLDRLARPGASV
ncbi:hypothetical protein [Kitasatospora cinereorecta]|uniref:Uncharacterized protein n=1 Tax=Kitasatospora cinereorecta TaxID=285560 RepID=A0ABW0VE12_9ACTN